MNIWTLLHLKRVEELSVLTFQTFSLTNTLDTKPTVNCTIHALWVYWVFHGCTYIHTYFGTNWVYGLVGVGLISYGCGVNLTK